MFIELGNSLYINRRFSIAMFDCQRDPKGIAVAEKDDQTISDSVCFRRLGVSELIFRSYGSAQIIYSRQERYRAVISKHFVGSCFFPIYKYICVRLIA